MTTLPQVEGPSTYSSRFGRMENARARRPGQSLVELSFIILILTLMFVGVAELGRAYSAWIQIGNMARAGAQYGSISAVLGDEQLAGVPGAALDDQAAIYGVAPQVDYAVLNDDFGFCAVNVTVTYDFAPLFRIGPIPDSITLTRSTQMRLQFVSALMEMPNEDNPCR